MELSYKLRRDRENFRDCSGLEDHSGRIGNMPISGCLSLVIVVEALHREKIYYIYTLAKEFKSSLAPSLLIL